MSVLWQCRTTTFFCIVLVFFNTASYATKISGSITDDHNRVLSYVNVFVQGTTGGTTSNVEGLFFLELAPGEYSIQFRLIGYKQKVEKVVVGNNPVVLKIELVPESYNLKEVTVKADAEDPAYQIIRNAQKQRKFYLEEVTAYSAEVYVKSTQRLLEHPKKILGQKVEIDEFVDSTSGIFYLSESVSKLNFRQPDLVREEMISSKVSGEPQTYSFNMASDLLFNFYDNLVTLSGLTPRGIVSPVASNAFLYYRYRLEGTFIENGYTVNKIKVIPKRVSDPVFTGDIYILDDSWRIHSADLFITKNQQMEFVDTFRIRQSFIPVADSLWMPFHNEYRFEFNVLGFSGNGLVLGIFNKYNLHPGFPPRFFNGQIMKINAGSNERDSSYWNQLRPVPLTIEENTDYTRRDSVRIIHESKPYRDSVDKVNNKFKFGNIFTGYDWDNSYRHVNYSVSSILQNVQFNTVEGWNAELQFGYRKGFGEGDRRRISITPSLRYGFSNTHFNGHVKGSYRYDPRHLGTLSADVGTDVLQFNSDVPISPVINSAYSLTARKNFMKLYEKRYLNAFHQSELWNGIGFGIGGEYSERLPLVNTSDYSFASKSKRDYTSNNPLNPVNDDYAFVKDEAFIVEARLRIRFHQEYIDRPDGKFITGSKYPTFRAQYKKGLSIGGSDVDFDFIKLLLEDEFKLGLLGRFEYNLAYGDFLSDSKINFMDYAHFNGNKTAFSSFRMNDFRNLEYYTYSTTNAFFEAHAEQNFGGFILNKIPLIRKLKLNEVAGIHYLHTSELDNYAEVAFGIEKLNAFRAEIFTSFTNGKSGPIGFMFGIKKSFGFGD